ncbi:MAG: endolytic transglycosylase MltG, partial [Gammaproteobacteria bacterium]|nr:endolytic transglycosylase MltG [Gammaproteobacteria bacterium]
MREQLYKLAAVGILLGSFVIGWYWLGYQQFLDTPIQLKEAEQSLQIDPGQSLRVVARNLAKEGIITDERYFRLLARLSGKSSKIQAGEYLLTEPLRPEALLNKLVEGKVRQYGLTLIEGWKFSEMLAFVRESSVLKHTLKGESPEEIMVEIGYPDVHPEGRFLPDTYHFPKGMSDREFLRRAYQTMELFLKQAWDERDQSIPLKSPYEALILASIVEKETGKASER